MHANARSPNAAHKEPPLMMVLSNAWRLKNEKHAFRAPLNSDALALCMQTPRRYCGLTQTALLHPGGRDICRSDVIGFLCEMFLEREPNASKLPGLALRVDFVCLRADGPAVRLHPVNICVCPVWFHPEVWPFHVSSPG